MRLCSAGPANSFIGYRVRTKGQESKKRVRVGVCESEDRPECTGRWVQEEEKGPAARTQAANPWASWAV